MSICLQFSKSASVQPRTSPDKFIYLFFEPGPGFSSAPVLAYLQVQRPEVKAAAKASGKKAKEAASGRVAKMRQGITKKEMVTATQLAELGAMDDATTAHATALKEQQNELKARISSDEKVLDREVNLLTDHRHNTAFKMDLGLQKLSSTLKNNEGRFDLGASGDVGRLRTTVNALVPGIEGAVWPLLSKTLQGMNNIFMQESSAQGEALGKVSKEANE